MKGPRQVIVNARLFDSASGSLRPGTTIVIEGEHFVAVSQEPLQVDDAQIIDAGGRVVMPASSTPTCTWWPPRTTWWAWRCSRLRWWAHKAATSCATCCSAASPPCAMSRQQPHRPHRRHAVQRRRTASGGGRSRSRQPVCPGPRLFTPLRDTGGAGRYAQHGTRQPHRRSHGACHEDPRHLPGAHAVHLRCTCRRRAAPGWVTRHAGQAAWACTTAAWRP